MKFRRYLAAAVVGAALLGGLAACQTGATMWAACSPAADGNPTGTDGTYVLVCKDGTWQPLMTAEEYVALARGEDVTIAPLPTRPTTTTTVAASTVDQSVAPQRAGSAGRYSISCGTTILRAQTFTAGRSGTLDKVSLALVGPVPVTVEIRTVDGSGTPTSTVLGSGAAAGPFPEQPTPDETPALVDIPLSSPATVVQEVRYAIVFTNAAGCTAPVAGDAYLWLTDYDRGDALTTTVGSLTNWGQAQANDDLAFRTWVR